MYLKKRHVKYWRVGIGTLYFSVTLKAFEKLNTISQFTASFISRPSFM
jgi:hypothetical protein